MKKLIAVDVDGTLINDEHKITERTKKALIEAQKQGHKVVIVSGRSPQGVVDYARELEMDVYESYISNQNGSIVTDMKTMETPIKHTMDLDLVREILRFSEDLDIDYMIYHYDKVYTNKPNTCKLDEVVEKNFDVEVIIDPDLIENIDFEPHNILMAQEPLRIMEPATKIMDKFGDQTSTMFSAPYFFEIMPKNVSKGHSIHEIADLLGIDHENILAFGDQDNDVAMIQAAGTGVAMGNAIDSLKAIADDVTLTNNEDGIAVYLEQHVLNK